MATVQRVGKCVKVAGGSRTDLPEDLNVRVALHISGGATTLAGAQIPQDVRGWGAPLLGAPHARCV